MWRAPTADEWKRPVLITFQRTWEDAVAVSKETGKPILVCVNMDGEIASEHYAGIRYRQPEIAKLYEPYVCVIASTYRHNPRDYDDEGRRILCPRFGSVTCGEHIAIEPFLFEKFFDGERVAPRHIMVELDGEEQYDVYYAFDTASVFDAIQKGITDRKISPRPVVRGDRSIIERVASRDIRDREAVEAAYREGDETQRAALLEAAKKQGGDAPLDLLRLAVFGLDPNLAKSARGALAQSSSAAATDLIDEALRVPIDDTEREALVAALERLGEKSPRAQWLSVVHRGLSGKSASVDAEAWAKSRKAARRSWIGRDMDDLESEHASKAGVYRASPGDAAACVGHAEASLALAIKARKTVERDPRLSRMLARHLLEDARLAALRAEELGQRDWRTNAILALAAYYRGDPETAHQRAEAAVEDLPAGEGTWNSMAVLSLFAEARWTAIKKAMDEGRRVPPKYIADVNSAYAALRKHPHGTDAQVVWHIDFLEWLGARRQVDRILMDGVIRFPGSAVLHRRLRKHVLMTRGAEALGPVYDRLIEKEGASARLEWFAAYAGVVAAEFHRRAGQGEKALASYDRAIGLFESAVKREPGLGDAAAHRIALALAGRARVSFETGDLRRALDDMLRSLELRSGSAGTEDGLGITPAATAKDLLARLVADRRMVLADKLRKAIAKLDPDLLPQD
jgi:tetratricopeptide (TPR) repeat protein